MNKFIKRILRLPGRYAITSILWLASGRYYIIEVDADGRAYQLNPNGERDGELQPDRWVGNEIVLDMRALDEPEEWRPVLQ